MGGNNNDRPSSITTDVNNNVYVGGTFTSTVIYFGSSSLTNGGINNVFLTKYDPNGNVLWARTAMGNAFLSATLSAIATDASGNTYVAGVFGSPSMTLGSFTLTNSNGSQDIFIAKYNSSGNVMWAKSVHGQSSECATGICVSSNNLYITGYFSSDTLHFGTTPLVNQNSYTDSYVAKYDLNGNFIWAKSVSGNFWDESVAITGDASGNVFICGNSTSNVVSLGSSSLTNSGGYDVFIAKYNSSGGVLWATSAKGSNDDYAQSISSDPSGNIFVCGYFGSDTLSFGNYHLNNTLSTNSEIFVVKYSGAGTTMWANRAGGTKGDWGRGVSTDGAGNAYLTGNFFSDTATFGNFTLYNDPSNFGSDMYVAKYSPSGSITWIKEVEGPYDEVGYSITVDNSGSPVVCGIFTDSACVIQSTALHNYNYAYADGFVAKLSSVVGIPDNNFQEMRIYPNPTSEYVRISYSRSESPRTVIYDILGNKLLECDTIIPSEGIYIGDLPNGTYFINVSSSTEYHRQKFVILR